MARIVIPVTTLIGRGLNSLTIQIIVAQQSAARLKSVVDALTNNGAQKALLESSPESQMPAGSATALYDGVTQIKTALDSLSTLVSTIDQNL